MVNGSGPELKARCLSVEGLEKVVEGSSVREKGMSVGNAFLSRSVLWGFVVVVAWFLC